MADPYGRAEMRYWDGTRWTDNVTNNGVPSVDALVAPPSPPMNPQPPIINITNTATAVNPALALVGLKRTHHGIHFVMTILTLGLWIPVWILVHYSNKRENYKNFGVRTA